VNGQVKATVKIRRWYGQFVEAAWYCGDNLCRVRGGHGRATVGRTASTRTPAVERAIAAATRHIIERHRKVAE
jgi:hypothetical protein